MSQKSVDHLNVPAAPRLRESGKGNDKGSVEVLGVRQKSLMIGSDRQ
jgi:hypothetical protein